MPLTYTIPLTQLNKNDIPTTGAKRANLGEMATASFILAGLGVLGVPGLSTIWRAVSVISSCLSLLLLILFWHPWLIVGVLIDIGLLVALL